MNDVIDWINNIISQCKIYKDNESRENFKVETIDASNNYTPHSYNDKFTGTSPILNQSNDNIKVIETLGSNEDICIEDNLCETLNNNEYNNIDNIKQNKIINNNVNNINNQNKVININEDINNNVQNITSNNNENINNIQNNLLNNSNENNYNIK